MAAIEMAGQRYGRLLVLHRSGACAQNGGAAWRVMCDCGRSTVVPRQSLISGRTQSCGCLAAEAGRRNAPIAHAAATKHGLYKSKVYYTWQAMKRRCHDERAPNYGRYGARGIAVCKEWRESFEAFVAHVGHPPTKKHSIDRIDNSGNYEPGNVRWATAKQQADNRRPNKRSK